MEHREDKYKEELVVYPHNTSDRLNIECAPDLDRILRMDLHLVEYGGVVPGRQIFPTDYDIPLRTYDEIKKVLSPILAYVRITHQELARTGTGKITNIEYRVKSVC
ncbi:MAG: hypothetical protein AABX17_01870 [Nanoarchaeota archaeon]